MVYPVQIPLSYPTEDMSDRDALNGSKMVNCNQKELIHRTKVFIGTFNQRSVYPKDMSKKDALDSKGQILLQARVILIRW